MRSLALLSLLLAHGVFAVSDSNILPRVNNSAPPCVNSPENRQCWGQYDINTDYYKITPDTGRTVEVSFILGYELKCSIICPLVTSR